MIPRLVFENLKHRPIRTALSAVAIGLQVTMVLTLVGVSRGMLDESARRQKGTNADIVIRAGGSAILGFGVEFTAKLEPAFRQYPGVADTTGILVQSLGMLDGITGIDYDSFNRMSGGFKFIEGGPFTNPDEILVDDIYARSKGVKAGDYVKNILGADRKIAGVVESGKLSRMFMQRARLQELTGKSEKYTAVYVKVADPSKTEEIAKGMSDKFPNNSIFSMEELASLMSVNNIPMLRTFIRVVIGLGVFIGFLVVFLSMYTAVLERTREIGILKALGASPSYILSILLTETVLLSLIGSVLGVIFTFGTRWIMHVFVPEMVQITTPDWWPIAGGIAVVGSLVGAVYPGLKAAKQDAIEALAYD
ncbi:ABC transporter permease [Bryobacterales bacterium F-183]|nr:ABC transporter permease [Bryobacterales bacterium F-183]